MARAETPTGSPIAGKRPALAAPPGQSVASKQAKPPTREAPQATQPANNGIIVLDDGNPAAAGEPSQGDVIVVSPQQAPFAKKPLGKLDLKSLMLLEKRVLRSTSEIRGLPIKRPVPVGIANGKNISAIMANAEKEDHAKGQILATEIYMRQLDLAPAGFDFRKVYGSALGEQLAGYYSPRDRKFYLTQNCAPAEAEVVMSHELTHALQDQHFDLMRLRAAVPDTSDARLALSSVIEGDATYNMAHYMATVNPALISTMMASESNHENAAFHAMPHYLSDSMVFPYRAGILFIKQLKDSGIGPDRAFTHLPRSTEQVMHPEKYVSDDKPVLIALPNVTAQLGAGWRLVDQDVNGEYALGLALCDQLGPRASGDAALNWGGDKCAVYSGPGGATLILQDTVWDNIPAAQKWAQAYATAAGMRFPNSFAERGKLQLWNNGKKGVWMVSEGKRVFIIEGSVGAFSPEKLLAACKVKF